MNFGQEVIELTHASRFRAYSDRTVTPSVIQKDIERIEIITGGKVKFGNNVYGKGAIFRHLEGDTTVHVYPPGKPYRCLSLHFKLKKKKSKRDFPRLIFWQNRDTLEDFVRECVEGFHNPKTDMEILGAYIYSTINWHSSQSVKQGGIEDIPQAIKTATAFLNQHTESWIPVDDLSEMTGLSKPYFQALFKKYTGTTPHRYHMEKRIGLACEKLAYGEDSVADISDECGFENLESFYRAFKKITRTTPAQYRKKHSPRFWE